MGGVDPAGDHVLTLLRSGRSVVTANKQLVARHGVELFAAAAAGGAQLRFEASVCAAIPVIKVLRESLVVTNVHRVLGIVNGTTNFMLSAMSEGQSYAEALAEAQRLGYAEADPTDDVGGLDAAAKMAILATVAFGTRVPLEWVEVQGIDALREEHVEAARALDMRVKLLGRATLAHGRVDVRVGPAFVDAHHPLAAVDGPFNAVMLQGDPVWRQVERTSPGELPSLWYLRVLVDDRAGVLARLAHELAVEGVSVARLVQQPANGHAVLHVVTHEAPAGRVEAALTAIRALPDSRGEATALPVVSERGVEQLGWA